MASLATTQEVARAQAPALQPQCGHPPSNRPGLSSPNPMPQPVHQEAAHRAGRLAERTSWLSASSPNDSHFSIYEMFIFLKSGG